MSSFKDPEMNVLCDILFPDTLCLFNLIKVTIMQFGQISTMQQHDA